MPAPNPPSQQRVRELHAAGVRPYAVAWRAGLSLIVLGLVLPWLSLSWLEPWLAALPSARLPWSSLRAAAYLGVALLVAAVVLAFIALAATRSLGIVRRRPWAFARVRVSAPLLALAGVGVLALVGLTWQNTGVLAGAARSVGADEHGLRGLWLAWFGAATIGTGIVACLAGAASWWLKRRARWSALARARARTDPADPRDRGPR